MSAAVIHKQVYPQPIEHLIPGLKIKMNLNKQQIILIEINSLPNSQTYPPVRNYSKTHALAVS